MNKKKTVKKIAPRYRPRVRRILKVLDKLSGSDSIEFSKNLEDLMFPWCFKMKRLLRQKRIKVNQVVQKKDLAEIFLHNKYLEELLNKEYDKKNERKSIHRLY